MTADRWDDFPPPQGPTRVLRALLGIVTSIEVVAGVAMLLLMYACTGDPARIPPC